MKASIRAEHSTDDRRPIERRRPTCRSSAGWRSTYEGSGRIVRGAAAAAFLVAVSAAVAFPVFASSEGVEEGWGWLGTVGRWTNLLVLFGLVFYFVRRPIGRFFRERRAGIRKEIEEAAADHQQVREQTLAVEERLRRLDEELAEIRRTAKREAEAERQRVIEQARLDADRILENARQEVGMLTRAAQKQLREYAARLSVDIAEARIRREVTPDDERRVVDRFLNDLAGGTEK